MSKYLVQVDWSGYSRGTAEWSVEADSKEDAMKRYYEGVCMWSDTVRDDTEGEALSAEEIG